MDSGVNFDDKGIGLVYESFDIFTTVWYEWNCDFDQGIIREMVLNGIIWWKVHYKSWFFFFGELLIIKLYGMCLNATHFCVKRQEQSIINGFLVSWSNSVKGN